MNYTEFTALITSDINATDTCKAIYDILVEYGAHMAADFEDESNECPVELTDVSEIGCGRVITSSIWHIEHLPLETKYHIEELLEAHANISSAMIAFV